MTAITDTKLIIETLAGKTITGPKLATIVEDIINYDASMDLSNEEKAQMFIDNLKKQLKSTMRSHAQQRYMRQQEADASLAGDTAVADL